MITEFGQLISGQNSMKTEILLDHAAPRAPAPGASSRTALTVTTRPKAMASHQG
jgi:hypothetical protein